MQPQVFEEINWMLVLSILAGSALLAYLGDVLGSKYGKQRISLFGLRPRHTSQIITAFTGVFISVAVLAVMAFFSQNFRVMLFTYQHLQQQLTGARVDLQNTEDELEKAITDLDFSQLRRLEQETLLQMTAASLDMARIELDRSRNDRDLLLVEKNDLEASVTSLRQEAEALKRELEVMRREAIVIPAGLLLSQHIVLPGMPEDRIRSLTASLDTDARAALFARAFERNLPISGSVGTTLDPREEAEFIRRAADSPDRLYVRALAAENVALGESVRIRLDWGQSYLLYGKGETFYRRVVDPAEADFNAEQALHLFLREVRIKATRDGVLPDPASGSVGSLEGEDFFEVVENLKSRGLPVIINAVALEDIYTEGPVRIKIELE